MTDTGEERGGPAELRTAVLASLRAHVDAAAEFAEQWGEPFRAAIFQSALAILTERFDKAQSAALTRVQTTGGATIGPPPSPDSSPLSRLAQVMGVELDTLSRAVSIQDDGTIQLLGRVSGKSVSELQKRYSVVYCYIKEKAFGQQLIDVEELRTLCMAKGCYDQANFAAHYRRDGLLRLANGKTARERKYVASPAGLNLGEALLREMLAG